MVPVRSVRDSVTTLEAGAVPVRISVWSLVIWSSAELPVSSVIDVKSGSAGVPGVGEVTSVVWFALVPSLPARSATWPRIWMAP